MTKKIISVILLFISIGVLAGCIDKEGAYSQKLSNNKVTLDKSMIQKDPVYIYTGEEINKEKEISPEILNESIETTIKNIYKSISGDQSITLIPQPVEIQWNTSKNGKTDNTYLSGGKQIIEVNAEINPASINQIMKSLQFTGSALQDADGPSESVQGFQRGNTGCLIHTTLRSDEYITQKIDISCGEIK